MDLRIIDLGINNPQKQKILVVDDDANVQSLVFDSLCNYYQIITASNGREALSRAEFNKPDLILMDIVMPDMGGYEAVRSLQHNAATKEIPVLVFTAQDFDKSTIDMIRGESNVVGFVRKPFKPQPLRETVKMAMEKRPKPKS